MNTHSNEHLHCRPFGSACLDTQHLQEWLSAHRRRVPVELTRDYVQVEWLLAAIQGQVERSVTRAEATEIVLADPLLRDHELAEMSPHWLLGGEAYRRWSLLIGEAITAGELELLDFASKLPAAQEAAKPTTIEAESDADDSWKTKVWTLAQDIYAKNFARGWGYDKDTVAGEIEKICGPDQLNLRTDTRKHLTKMYILRHGLVGWSDHFGRKQNRQTEPTS